MNNVEQGITQFNQGDFAAALTTFNNIVPRTKLSISMMVKCFYRQNQYHDAVLTYNLFPFAGIQLVDLSHEMNYIRARCYYEAAQRTESDMRINPAHVIHYTPNELLSNALPRQINDNNNGSIMYTRSEYLTNALLIVLGIVELNNQNTVKFRMLIPQIYLAQENYRNAYYYCTKLMNSNLSKSNLAEVLVIRARCARVMHNDVSAMRDYEEAAALATNTTNYGLLGIIYAEMVGHNGREYAGSQQFHLKYTGDSADFQICESYNNARNVQNLEITETHTINCFILANENLRLYRSQNGIASAFVTRCIQDAENFVSHQVNNWISRELAA